MDDHGEILTASRDPLAVVRDVLAIVFYALGSAVCVLILYVAVTAGLSLVDGAADPAPTPASTCPASDYC